jgi:transposase InsO family protein
MPWKEVSLMSTRLEFIRLARAPGANIQALCRSFEISRKTAYKWLERFEDEGAEGLQDRSRRPHSSPLQSPSKLEAQVLALHDQYPCWGSRKLRALLPEHGCRPHPSTIDAILKRHGRQILGAVRGDVLALGRFEHPAPNLLWQMDFKGHFPLTDSRAGRCHPLTILDDHSRFNLCLAACANEQGTTVQAAMKQAFRRYGLPERITADNGPPWGTAGKQGISAFAAWIIRQGIRLSHSRPYHPQTQGKDERFHRTLKLEVIERQGFRSIAACQTVFDDWRHIYNQIRPHHALGQQPPATRYCASGRPFREIPLPIEYLPEDRVLKVRKKGQVHLKEYDIFIGEGLAGEYIALRPTSDDGIFKVFFCHQEISEIDLRDLR